MTAGDWSHELAMDCDGSHGTKQSAERLFVHTDLALASHIPIE